MRVWNTGNKEIKQFYNNKLYIMPANKEIDVFDDLGVFLLNKKDIRGFGLVQLKDGDEKAERFKQGKNQIYNWAVEKYNDYLKHCEERKDINQSPIPPHKEILEYKKTIDEYETWELSGFPMDEKYNQKQDNNRFYACPMCSKEYKDKNEYFEHLKTHERKEDVNIGTTQDKSS